MKRKDKLSRLQKAVFKNTRVLNDYAREAQRNAGRTRVLTVLAHSNIRYIYRLLHRKCAVRIFIHELQNFGKRTSERSERVSLPKFCDS